ncbi:hypothetical protein LZ198_31920 [Myxococcus sp. K15C18031901]|uniref:hypothetical protein n=1 Tax=Myxococcus dinghuensis TaxID=2906761 RepID=UPI0020A78D0E|nr:hypothetical protein [Myxococcus dinghuensis]MCP3103501.1 hypothetical protein [Myxococcus dinghuensis]
MRLLRFAVLMFWGAGCGAHSRRQPEPLPGPDKAEPVQPSVDDAELLRVQRSALYIVEAERAAIRATDILLADETLDRSRLQWFFTLPFGGAWYGLFGKVDDAGTFNPSYALKAPFEAPEWMERIPVEGLPTDFSHVARAVRTAVQTAHEAFGSRRVNLVVRLEASGELTVYVLQGSHHPGRVNLGGDFRFRFGPDGRTLLEKTQLHQGVFEARAPSGDTSEGAEVALHTHVLFPGPLETELALVMLYPELGMLVVAPQEAGTVYVLLPDGAIWIRTDAPAQRRVLKPDGTFEFSDLEAPEPAPSQAESP